MPPAEELFAENSALKAQLDELRQERAQLQVQIAWLRQQLFGGGKSEKLDRAQLLLKLGELEKLAAAPTPPRPVAAQERAAPTPSTARTLPAETFAHLPVQERSRSLRRKCRPRPRPTSRSARSVPSKWISCRPACSNA